MFKGVKTMTSRLKSSRQQSEDARLSNQAVQTEALPTSPIQSTSYWEQGNNDGLTRHRTESNPNLSGLDSRRTSGYTVTQPVITRPQLPTPIRPPRPDMPGFVTVLGPESPTDNVSSRIVHISPTRFSGSSSGHPKHFYRATSHAQAGIFAQSSTSPVQSTHPPLVADGSWYVPVPVLDKSVYPFEYQFGGTIGEGGFGKVLLALNIETKEQYAIKAIAIRRLRSRRETASIANEIKVLWKVAQEERPFLARPARVRDWFWQYRGNIHLVTEYYKGGDLGRGAIKHPELRNPYRFKLMVAEVVIAILTLHDMHIIHHDIKPSNLLIDGEGHCIVADYGGACFTTGTDNQSYWLKDQTPIFTLRYAAPEVLLNGPAGRSYGVAADFWSLGVTLFELATGQDLIDEVDDDQIVFAIQSGQVNLEQLSLLSTYPGLHRLVSSLLVHNPTERLQGYNIKMHDYFAEFSQAEWSAIYMKQRPPFPSNKQSPINPRNTSYDYIDRPGESLLDDANEDIVCRWLAEDGIGMPHHRDSDYHRRHKNNAQIGLPIRARKQSEVVWKGVSIEPGMI